LNIVVVLAASPTKNVARAAAAGGGDIQGAGRPRHAGLVVAESPFAQAQVAAADNR